MLCSAVPAVIIEMTDLHHGSAAGQSVVCIAEGEPLPDVDWYICRNIKQWVHHTTPLHSACVCFPSLALTHPSISCYLSFFFLPLSSFPSPSMLSSSFLSAFYLSFYLVVLFCCLWLFVCLFPACMLFLFSLVQSFSLFSVLLPTPV